MLKSEPPNLDNLPDTIDPDNIPGIGYYMDVWKEPGNAYPKCPNSYDDLTVKGFVKAANLMADRFGEICEKAKVIMYGKQCGN